MKRKRKIENFMVYLADTLYYSARNQGLTKRWIELQPEYNEEPEQDDQEIIDSIKEKFAKMGGEIDGFIRSGSEDNDGLV